MWGVTGYHGLEPVGFRNYKANAATEVLSWIQIENPTINEAQIKNRELRVWKSF